MGSRVTARILGLDLLRTVRGFEVVRRSAWWWLGLGACGLTAAVLSSGVRAVGAAENEAARPEFYATRVKPILDANCARCHGGMNHRGGLSLDTRAGMLKGGHEGAVVVPGDPDRSLLLRLMRRQGPQNDPMPMPPPPRAKVSDADIEVVAQWIRAGAVMPADAPKP